MIHVKVDTSGLDDYETYDFYRRARFKSIIDAWHHVHSTIPSGRFVQILLNSKIVCFGYNGSQKKVIVYAKTSF